MYLLKRGTKPGKSQPPTPLLFCIGWTWLLLGWSWGGPSCRTSLSKKEVSADTDCLLSWSSNWNVSCQHHSSVVWVQILLVYDTYYIPWALPSPSVYLVEIWGGPNQYYTCFLSCNSGQKRKAERNRKYILTDEAGNGECFLYQQVGFQNETDLPTQSQSTFGLRSSSPKRGPAPVNLVMWRINILYSHRSVQPKNERKRKGWSRHAQLLLPNSSVRLRYSTSYPHST